MFSKVKLTRADGRIVVFKNQNVDPVTTVTQAHERGTKEMDCIDCHNRPTHIYRSAEEALDSKITSGKISRELPFIKRQTLKTITVNYKTREEANKTIVPTIISWYTDNYPDLSKEKRELITRAAGAALEAYNENVFPKMKIGWDTYSKYIGHHNDSGCFRCHNDEFEAEDGSTITQDCESCHTLLAEEEESPRILELLKGEG